MRPILREILIKTFSQLYFYLTRLLLQAPQDIEVMENSFSQMSPKLKFMKILFCE